MKTILSIVFLFLVYILCTFSLDKFTIVGYNSTSLPPNTIITAYERETTEIGKVFASEFTDNDLSNNEYTLYGQYIEFPFGNVFKRIIVDHLKTNVALFKKDKIEINSDIQNLYWKDVGEDRLFIFNVNLLNNTHFLTRNIKVKLMIGKISDFLSNGMYRVDISPSLLTRSTKILSVRLDTNSNTDAHTHKIAGLDTFDPSFYQIQNTLFLMDPFYTSQRDAVITPEMKRKFEEELQNREKLREPGKANAS